MRRAVIDLGTNTFNLLVGEINDGKLTVLYSTKRPVLLGMGGINQGRITQDAMQRAEEALSEFKLICDQHGAQSIKGIGTSALRAASNNLQLVNFALERLGISIEIVSGEKEAEYIYSGVCGSHKILEPSIIMDIGGGSTEFIHADQSRLLGMSSLDIGVSRIFQQLDRPGEYSEQDVSYILEFLETTEGGALKGMDSNVLIGSSGSFETLYEMTFKRSFPLTNEAVEIPINELKKVLNDCISSTLEERMQNEWIVPIRKKMLPIATVKIRWIVEKFGIQNVYVSPYSLKEGVMLS